MKIEQLFETEKGSDIDILNTRLVVTSNHASSPLFIITDIPHLSHPQFINLVKQSFGNLTKTGAFNDVVPLLVVFDEGRYAVNPKEYLMTVTSAMFKHFTIEKEITWTQFVLYIEHLYATGSGDDFTD